MIVVMNVIDQTKKTHRHTHLEDRRLDSDQIIQGNFRTHTPSPPCPPATHALRPSPISRRSPARGDCRLSTPERPSPQSPPSPDFSVASTCRPKAKPHTHACMHPRPRPQPHAPYGHAVMAMQSMCSPYAVHVHTSSKGPKRGSGPFTRAPAPHAAIHAAAGGCVQLCPPCPPRRSLAPPIRSSPPYLLTYLLT